MRVFRLSREKYKNELSGYGAALKGQRWNSKGIEVIYTAESRSLAAFEVAVHLSLHTLPKDYFMIEIEIPDNLEIGSLSINHLPDGWNSIPPVESSQIIGDKFVKDNMYPVLQVPSTVIPGDFNYIINPKHKDFDKITIIETTPFPFDPRLKK